MKDYAKCYFKNDFMPKYSKGIQTSQHAPNYFIIIIHLLTRINFSYIADNHLYT